MADNPFNIDSLNSVNFDADQLRTFQFPITSSNGGVSGDSRIMPYNVSDLPGVSDPGVITVINNEYTAGFLNSGIPLPQYPGYYEDRYYLPTFGSIQFSNYVDGDGNPIELWIKGFTENGMILTAKQDAYWSGTSGYPMEVLNAGGDIIPFTGVSGGFIFGVYGVANASDSNIPPGAVVANQAIFDRDSSVFCFAEGTLIATASGKVAVETLSVGDPVLTASGEERLVKWIGRTVARPARHRRPHEVNPVCVRAHAFGPSLPERDLRLSPGHAVYVEGVLVPVVHLVNGATIVQEDVEQIRYYHVELDAHDVLLAEGLPCESYLNDGNRFSALNASEFTELYGRIDPVSWDDACAPLVADGPQLAAIRQRLLAEAEAQGWARCEEPGLVIEADGVTILPEELGGSTWRFAVPAARSVVLRSNAGVLADVMPELADRRTLGVAVSGLRVNGAVLDLEDAAFGRGFDDIERHETIAWRWTDGAASLVLGGEAWNLEVTLAMVAPSWKRSASIQRIAA
ncbi:Hint domain-containing protein [Hephaestia caeni]|uniref:Hint domain-containing protein n=1 Tax=Hephaestia caeni TaxID=645617 RepID=A0A397PGM5_9SPHN|nr:Hint domain-containing protein [Hephaestia caeni]RIA46327.1 Hint domain-containing protein [Hephaestia caeni]